MPAASVWYPLCLGSSLHIIMRNTHYQEQAAHLHCCCCTCCSPAPFIPACRLPGMCHSDLHTINGDWGDAKYPVVPGWV
jgi:hypothetical protein